MILVLALLAGCGGKPPVSEKKEEAKPEHEHEHGHIEVALDQQKANRFEFATVEERAVTRPVRTTGTIGPNEARVARVRPLARGRILSVSVRIGDFVKKGQELMRYDNVELGEAVGQYLRAAVQGEKARTEAAVAKRALERAQKLVDLGGIARMELDKREAEAKNAEASIGAARAEQALWGQKLYRFGLTEREIEALRDGTLHRESSVVVTRAPFEGIVLKMSAAEGETIQPETLLFEVVDTSTVWVQADLAEQDLGRVRLGDRAAVLLEAYPDRQFPCRVTYVGDTVDPDSRMPKMRCEAGNADRRMKLDMFATLLLAGRAESPALMAPAAAVQRLEGKTMAFVREEETEFEMRTVVTGLAVDGWVEILAGLKKGETVVTRGSFVLKAEHSKAELGEAGHSHD